MKKELTITMEEGVTPGKEESMPNEMHVEATHLQPEVVKDHFTPMETRTAPIPEWSRPPSG